MLGILASGQIGMGGDARQLRFVAGYCKRRSSFRAIPVFPPPVPRI